MFRTAAITWLVCSIGMYGFALLEYHFQESFIQGQLNAGLGLPFWDAVLLDFARHEWWTFLVAIVAGFVLMIGAIYQLELAESE